MKLNTKTVTMIEVSDWDAFVKEVYGKPYSFQQQDGCKDRGIFNLEVPLEVPLEDAYDYKNDTIPEEVNGNEMGVSFKAWLARDPRQSLRRNSQGEFDPKQPLPNREDNFYITLFWDRNFYPSIDILANDLYNKGLLEAGEYIINIDW